MSDFLPDGRPGVDLALRRAQATAMLDLGRIHAVVQRRAAALFTEVGLDDITPAQSNVLMLLFNTREPLTARQIHRAIGVAEPTVCRFIKALQSNGWIDRRKDPNDARAILVEPSEKAREALPTFIRVSNTLLDELFDGFTKTEVRQMVSNAQRMTANLET